MRVAVFGAGGVGGYLGARLAQAGAAEVTLLARGAHLTALREQGLTLRSVLGDAHVTLPATEDPGEVGPVDVVVFAVKSTDTETAAAQLAPMLGDETAVVSFQNGVDNEQRIAERVGEEHVVGGVALLFSTVAAPGVVEHTGGPTRFVVGELDGSRTPRLERLLRVCDEADLAVELSDDIRVDMWRKLAFICAQAGLTAATGLPTGEIRADTATWSMFGRLVEEVCAVAAAEGIALPDDTADHIIELASRLGPDGYSSLHHDLVHGKPMELEALNGTVARLGAQHGIPVPMNEAVHALLSPWATRNARGSRQS